MNINALIHYTQQLLQVERFKDYCPNGLQVQGKTEVRKIVTGVTASMALLQAAHEASADLILVHHGYFWRNEDPRIVGIKRNRLAFLLKHELNLAAYHLPLDAHITLGNNVQLGNLLGFELEGFSGDPAIIAYGQLKHVVNLQTLAGHIETTLGRKPLTIGDSQKIVKKIAWCTGAAQGYIESAIELGVDVFISGEISEQTTHLALESGVSYISAGHHVTERYGIKALGMHLADKFQLEHQFIDIENPV
ncbi:MAG: Nif3-like dinuclear metal center hexameric protein [Methylotenera sp.]|nr:MAG: Nif3-like dinuclear metal center hexameric protein [Methylotenera sp.]